MGMSGANESQGVVSSQVSPWSVSSLRSLKSPSTDFGMFISSGVVSMNSTYLTSCYSVQNRWLLYEYAWTMVSGYLGAETCSASFLFCLRSKLG
jgi:hypothetical protein